jgi:uncharacterized membrane protein
MTLYDLTCYQDAGLFGIFNCINTASNGILLHVTLIVTFLVITGVFMGSGKSVKNVMLLSTTITTLSAVMLQLTAASMGYSAGIQTSYGAATMVWMFLAFAALLYHYTSDL